VSRRSRLSRGPALAGILLASLASGLVIAGIGATIFGIPLALAAFIGGLAISEGQDAQEARERFLPFRDVFRGSLLRRDRDAHRSVPAGSASFCRW